MAPLSAPLDPQLPGLAAALDPASMSGRLGAMLGNASAAGEWRVVGVELIKHKPGRRCALAYTIEQPQGRARLFAKTFNNDRGAAILDQMTRFVDAFSSVPGTARHVVVPRPLGYVPEIRLLVTEFLEGELLAASLYKGRSDDPARRMAAALAELHGCRVACDRQWGTREELANTAKRVAVLPDRDRVRTLLEALDDWAAALPCVAGRPIHRDFYPEQVMELNGATALLDLDDVRCGDPALDLGNFLAHLTLRLLQFPLTAGGCRRARGAFLEAYVSAVAEVADPSFSERVRFYEATSVLRLSGVYAVRERWAVELPPVLLEACESILKKKGVCR